MPFQLNVAGDSDAIVAAEQQLQALLENAGLPSMVISRAVLVLEEVVLNACRHGGAPEVSVSVEMEERSCRLIFEDAGTPFDPLSGQFVATPPTHIDDLGGRGLLLIRRSATRSQYEHTGGRNRLVMDLKD